MNNYVFAKIDEEIEYLNNIIDSNKSSVRHMEELTSSIQGKEYLKKYFDKSESMKRKFQEIIDKNTELLDIYVLARKLTKFFYDESTYEIKNDYENLYQLFEEIVELLKGEKFDLIIDQLLSLALDDLTSGNEVKSLINEINMLSQSTSSEKYDIEYALMHRSKTYHGIYHDIGVITDQYSTKELVDYFIKNNESLLRNYIVEQITSEEINKERYKSKYHSQESQNEMEEELSKSFQKVSIEGTSCPLIVLL